MKPLVFSQDLVAAKNAIEARARLRRPNHIFPAISSNQNDWNPTDLATASTITVTATGARNITGLAAGAVGDEVTLRASLTSDTVTLKARDPTSTTNNWFVLLHDVVLKTYMSISFRYADIGGGQSGWIPIDGSLDPADFVAPVQSIASADGSIAVASTTGAYDLSGRLLARLATAAALPANTYSNGSSGVGATITINATGVLTVDGSSVALNDYVLVRFDTSKNGLYKCTTAGAVGVAAVLTRSDRMDSTGKYVGARVLVLSGTTGAGKTFLCNLSSAPTVGTTAVTFQDDSLPASPNDGDTAIWSAAQKLWIPRPISNVTPLSLKDTVLALSPTAYWPMDEASGATSFADASGNGFHLTSIGSNVAVGNGRFVATDDSKYPFFGGSGTLGQASKTGILGGSAPYTTFTLMAIVQTWRSAAFNEVFTIGASGETSAANIQAMLYIGGGTPVLLWESGSGTNNSSNCAIAPTFGKQLIVVVKDGATKTVKWYLNVTFINQTSYGTEATGGGSANTIVAGDQDGSSFLGYIAHIGFFRDVLLTETQIAGIGKAAGLYCPAD